MSASRPMDIRRMGGGIIRLCVSCKTEFGSGARTSGPQSLDLWSGDRSARLVARPEVGRLRTGGPRAATPSVSADEVAQDAAADAGQSLRFVAPPARRRPHPAGQPAEGEGL